MATNHNHSKERVDSLHDRAWNDFRFGVVPVPVQRSENALQNALEEFAIVKAHANPLENRRGYLERSLF